MANEIEHASEGSEGTILANISSMRAWRGLITIVDDFIC